MISNLEVEMTMDGWGPPSGNGIGTQNKTTLIWNLQRKRETWRSTLLKDKQ